MTSITLVADGARTVDNQYTLIPRQWATDEELTLDSLGLLTYLATSPAGTEHKLADLAEALAYSESTLRVIADDLVQAGYAEITGGDA